MYKKPTSFAQVARFSVPSRCSGWLTKAIHVTTSTTTIEHDEITCATDVELEDTLKGKAPSLLRTTADGWLAG